MNLQLVQPIVDAIHRRCDTLGGGGWFTIQAPGRANLIGEHIDYNGLSVLPMAIDRRIIMRARARSDRTVWLHNIDPRFPSVTFELADAIPSGPAGNWGNYLKAAAQAIAGAHPDARGIDAVVGSNLPEAAGLSSSSALVVATALTLLRAANLPIDRSKLMEQLAVAERYVGLRGGGMDQAICLAGRAGTAARIGFDPLTVEPVPVPADWRFLVASSLVVAEKAGAAKEVYHRRTGECRDARRAVARRLSLPDTIGYRALLERFDVDELTSVARELPDTELGLRFCHVVTEARRVDRAVTAMESSDGDTFGSLMSASHRSLRDDYQVSCPELDRLVDLAMEGGAAGARLTGAGLGGCILALAKVSAVPTIVQTLDRAFYNDLAVSDPDSVRFVVLPSDGAGVTG